MTETPPSALSSAAGPIVGLLQGRTSERVRKAVTAYVVVQTGWELGKRAKGWSDARAAYRVTVDGDDEMYPAVLERLLEMVPEADRRSLVASSSYATDGPVARATRGPQAIDWGTQADSGAPPPPKLRRLLLGFDGDVTQKVVLGGQSVKVHVSKPSNDGGSSERERRFAMEASKLEFSCRGAPARDAVLAWLGAIADLRVGEERKPRFFMATRWGDWDMRADLPLRTMATVVLADGQAEAIIEDLGTFFADEAAYNTLGLPWHRGYLLEGPPGTGKTSIAKALAHHFGMDVYYIPLAAMDNDVDLLRLVARVTPRSMLLLEDIDTSHVATDREDTGKKSLSGLLNALDGVATPHGLVTVMTSNFPDVLDSALLREGRVDRTFHVGALDDEQLGRLTTMFYGQLDEAIPAVPADAITPNRVVEVFKQHMRDPAGAMLAIKDLVA